MSARFGGCSTTPSSPAGVCFSVPVGVTPIAAFPDVSYYPPFGTLQLFPSFFLPSPTHNLPLPVAAAVAVLPTMGFFKETKSASRPDTDAQLGEKDGDAEQPRSPSLTGQTAIDERKLMAKIDWHVVPALCVMYLFAFLDRYVPGIVLRGGILCKYWCGADFHRVNISNAAILGLKEDLAIESGTKYNAALTIFFVPYIIFEVLVYIFRV